jgi:ATP-dependent Clp protease, protease subunit
MLRPTKRGDKMARTSFSRRGALLTLATGMFSAAGRAEERIEPQPTDGSRTYVIFQGGINPQTINQLFSRITQISTAEIYLAISSNGGEVMPGIAGYNFLKSLPRTIVTHNIGNVDSIANAVFLAGARRFAAAHSTFTFHGISRNVGQNATLSTSILQEYLQGNLADERKISDIIKERTKLPAERVDAFFHEGRTLSASEALEGGIVESIAELSIPKGAPVVVLP